MSKALSYLCATLAVFSLNYACAEDVSLNHKDSQAAAARSLFKPFTGKVKGKKVRMRLTPDLDSRVIKEMDKNELVLITNDKGDFWGVEPPAGTKAYVFRSFILDNTVEGNRVNVRLEPDLEAPVIGHLNAGDKVHGAISPLNNKWLEIAPPAGTYFYVAKEFIDNAGGPEVKKQFDKRKSSAEQILESAAVLSKAELRKHFDEIDIERISHNYNTVIHDYSDFPEYVDKAREALTSLQEAYIQKKIAYLEARNSASSREDRQMASAENQVHAKPVIDATDRMRLWEPIEESLYLTWAHVNEDKTMDEFYEEQKLAAVSITGILEAYSSPVKNKPGDFIIRDKDLPVAYVYSTQVNLQNLVGKKVSTLGIERPNNNFAFPAFFVLAVE